MIYEFLDNIRNDFPSGYKIGVPETVWVEFLKNEGVLIANGEIIRRDSNSYVDAKTGMIYTNDCVILID